MGKKRGVIFLILSVLSGCGSRPLIVESDSGVDQVTQIQSVDALAPCEEPPGYDGIGSNECIGSNLVRKCWLLPGMDPLFNCTVAGGTMICLEECP